MDQLDQVLEQILDQYKVLAQSRSLTIDNQIPAKPVYMDPAILKLVLSNVISNAVKAFGCRWRDPAPSRRKGRTGVLKTPARKW